MKRWLTAFAMGVVLMGVAAPTAVVTTGAVPAGANRTPPDPPFCPPDEEDCSLTNCPNCWMI